MLSTAGVCRSRHGKWEGGVSISSRASTPHGSMSCPPSLDILLATSLCTINLKISGSKADTPPEVSKMSSYTRATAADQIAADRSAIIKGKTILITGTSPGGLVAEFAQVISKHSPDLIILANRDVSKASETAKTISEIAPSVPTRILELDLASQAQIREAAKEVLEKYPETHIDVLVNNAGVMAGPYKVTADGIENQFGTNHIGHFLFTNLIMKNQFR